SADRILPPEAADRHLLYWKLTRATSWSRRGRRHRDLDQRRLEIVIVDHLFDRDIGDGARRQRHVELSDAVDVVRLPRKPSLRSAARHVDAIDDRACRASRSRFVSLGR